MRKSPFQIEQMNNLIHNADFTVEIASIKCEYLRTKLRTGLMKYEPKVWAESQLTPMEERELS